MDMPHPTEPNQIGFDYNELYNEISVANIVENQEFIDPRGAYATTATFKAEGQTGDSRAAWSIENTGVDLRIVGVQMRISQGAESGRADWTIGWGYSNGYAQESIVNDYGVGAQGGRNRVGHSIWFPDDMRPLWEFKDDLYVNVSPDSDSTDTTKCSMFMFVKPDEAMDGGTL